MRAVVQRVRYARVSVAGELKGEVANGLMVLVGAAPNDGAEDVRYIADKITNLRIFEDENGKMNRSVLDIAGGVLLISQFTLLGDARKGRRPAFTAACEPVRAERLYEDCVSAVRANGVATVQTGVFGADMAVELLNDGPVTILLDSTKLL